MKLYVWEGVLCDYRCGLAVALANSKEDAIKAIVGNEPIPYVVNELRAVEPKVYKVRRRTPIGFYVVGGG